MSAVEDLSELLLRRSADLGLPGKPMSSREAAARSKGAVSRATIDNLKARRHSGKIDDGTVDGLALAFDVPRSHILRAMNRSHLSGLRPFEAPERWQRLTHAQRRLVLSIGDGLLAAYEAGREDERHGGGEQARQEAEVQAAGRALLEQVADLQQPAGRRRRKT